MHLANILYNDPRKQGLDSPAAACCKYLIDQIKRLHTEVTAHRMAIEAFKTTHPQFALVLDESLAVAWQLPSLNEMMRSKYDAVLEKLNQLRAVGHERRQRPGEAKRVG